MRAVFVMDPVSTVLVEEDTSFALMLEAEGRGHRVDHCLAKDVGLEDGKVMARVRRASMRRDPSEPIALGEPEWVGLEDVDLVFVRKDPPFDDEYSWLTLVLERLRGRTLVLNDPRGLREANEKLYACHFPELMPRTFVGSDRERIKAFVHAVGGRAVIKPIDGHGGHGIFVLAEGDLNVNAAIESATRAGRRIAMVQEYLPAVREGDKRILLLAGESLGAIVRVPREDDARSNIHVGGRVEAAALDAHDHRIIETLRPRLLADGLLFVGLDVIGGKLTEVNVTSPTGIQQISRLSSPGAEARVLDYLEATLSQ